MSDGGVALVTGGRAASDARPFADWPTAAGRYWSTAGDDIRAKSWPWTADAVGIDPDWPPVE